MDDKEALMAALKRKAFGYTVSEQTTEYDGEGNEIKNKVSTKDVPPDLSAIKLLLEQHEEITLTEKELEEERLRLLKELADINKKKSQEKK